MKKYKITKHGGFRAPFWKVSVKGFLGWMKVREFEFYKDAVDFLKGLSKKETSPGYWA